MGAPSKNPSIKKRRMTATPSRLADRYLTICEWCGEFMGGGKGQRVVACDELTAHKLGCQKGGQEEQEVSYERTYGRIYTIPTPAQPWTIDGRCSQSNLLQDLSRRGFEKDKTRPFSSAEQQEGGARPKTEPCKV